MGCCDVVRPLSSGCHKVNVNCIAAWFMCSCASIAPKADLQDIQGQSDKANGGWDAIKYTDKSAHSVAICVSQKMHKE